MITNTNQPFEILSDLYYGVIQSIRIVSKPKRRSKAWKGESEDLCNKSGTHIAEQLVIKVRSKTTVKIWQLELISDTALKFGGANKSGQGYLNCTIIYNDDLTIFPKISDWHLTSRPPEIHPFF